MRWIDKVPSVPFTDDDIRYGAMNGVVADVLDMAAGDPEFPRLPPPVRLSTRWAAGCRQGWTSTRLFRLTDMLLAFGRDLNENETIFGMLAMALVPGGPLVGDDMRAHHGLRMAPGCLAQSRLQWRPPNRSRQTRESGWLEVVANISASPDHLPLSMDELVRFAKGNLPDIATAIRGYAYADDHERDMYHAANSRFLDTMLFGIPTSDTAEESP